MPDELTDLISGIKEVINPLAESLEQLYDEIGNYPDDFLLSKVGERKELKTLGMEDIPRKGRVITYVDNAWYYLQDDKFKSEFPELNLEKRAAAVEQVDKVSLTNVTYQVELTIIRYLIQEK